MYWVNRQCVKTDDGKILAFGIQYDFINDAIECVKERFNLLARIMSKKITNIWKLFENYILKLFYFKLEFKKKTKICEIKIELFKRKSVK